MDRISQAQLQEEKNETGKSKYIILDPDKGKGFYKLPKPDDGDLFFDIEGYPQEDGRGFEYLHGIYFKGPKGMELKYFWAKDFKKKYEKVFKTESNKMRNKIPVESRKYYDQAIKKFEVVSKSRM